MITENKQITKNVESVIKSAQKLRTLVMEEIKTIDEKYRILAEKEKKSLLHSADVLNEQIKSFSQIFKCDYDPSSEQTSDDENIIDNISDTEVLKDKSVENNNQKEEDTKVEDKLVDTIFKENNTLDEDSSDSSELENPEEQEEELDDVFPDEENKEDKTDSTSEDTTEEDEWADIPEDWN